VGYRVEDLKVKAQVVRVAVAPVVEQAMLVDRVLVVLAVKELGAERVETADQALVAAQAEVVVGRLKMEAI
jgi:hypothetical protein